MRCQKLKTLKERELLRHYFLLLDAYRGQGVPMGRIYQEAGEMVFISEDQAARLIRKLLKDSKTRKIVEDEIEHFKK